MRRIYSLRIIGKLTRIAVRWVRVPFLRAYPLGHAARASTERQDYFSALTGQSSSGRDRAQVGLPLHPNKTSHGRASSSWPSMEEHWWRVPKTRNSPGRCRTRRGPSAIGGKRKQQRRKCLLQLREGRQQRQQGQRGKRTSK